MSFSQEFLVEVQKIVTVLDTGATERMAAILAEVRNEQGRLFVLGVGGSAANASHAVNDFRKITGIETYAPTDNVSELTARTNDEGWATVFESWLRVSPHFYNTNAEIEKIAEVLKEGAAI
jgi:D-sedoheptulose 7-phosphate isomerase